MLGVACGQIIFGPLSDQFGRLPVIRVGTVTYIAFSLLSSLAWNIEYMWLARVAQGAAAASGAVIARALIRDRFEGDRAAQNDGLDRCCYGECAAHCTNARRLHHSRVWLALYLCRSIRFRRARLPRLVVARIGEQRPTQ